MIHKAQILSAPSEKDLCSYICNVFYVTNFTSLYQKTNKTIVFVMFYLFSEPCTENAVLTFNEIEFCIK